jgi:hypothetical protein
MVRVCLPHHHITVRIYVACYLTCDSFKGFWDFGGFLEFGVCGGFTGFKVFRV